MRGSSRNPAGGADSGRKWWLLAAVALVANAAISCVTQPQQGENRAHAYAVEWVNFPGAHFVDDDECRTCHDDRHTELQATRHWKLNDSRSPGAKHGCQECHGPGSIHSKNRQEGIETTGPDILTFQEGAPFPAAQKNQMCLSCHEQQGRQRWHMSLHAAHDLSCTDCHAVHQERGEPLLRAASEVETCGKCHRDIKAQLERPSHHPIREGKLACSSCHDAHGSGFDKNLVKSDANDTCFQCHQDKRGPFLHEHPPVFENCLNCHAPHGSNNYKLLVADLPRLCETCHSDSRHPGTLYDKSTTFEGDAGTSLFAPSNRMVHMSCVQCHSRIHGSNHPSGHTLLR